MKKIANTYIQMLLTICLILVCNSKVIDSSSRNSQAEELLDKIVLLNNNKNNSPLKYTQTGGANNEKIAQFLRNIANTSARETCSSNILQSNVQSQMRTLKSLISSCPGYCRLAVDQNGVIHGSKNEFSLESKLNQ